MGRWNEMYETSSDNPKPNGPQQFTKNDRNRISVVTVSKYELFWDEEKNHRL